MAENTKSGEKYLMKGNEALAEAAIRAGCKCFFGYPITPQTELAAYRAFRDENGAVTREDILQGLNRLSSLLWIFMIKLKAGKYGNTGA